MMNKQSRIFTNNGFLTSQNHSGFSNCSQPLQRSKILDDLENCQLSKETEKIMWNGKNPDCANEYDPKMNFLTNCPDKLNSKYDVLQHHQQLQHLAFQSDRVNNDAGFHQTSQISGISDVGDFNTRTMRNTSQRSTYFPELGKHFVDISFTEDQYNNLLKIAETKLHSNVQVDSRLEVRCSPLSPRSTQDNRKRQRPQEIGRESNTESASNQSPNHKTMMSGLIGEEITRITTTNLLLGKNDKTFSSPPFFQSSSNKANSTYEYGSIYEEKRNSGSQSFDSGISSRSSSREFQYGSSTLSSAQFPNDSTFSRPSHFENFKQTKEGVLVRPNTSTPTGYCSAQFQNHSDYINNSFKNSNQYKSPCKLQKAISPSFPFENFAVEKFASTHVVQNRHPADEMQFHSQYEAYDKNTLETMFNQTLDISQGLSTSPNSSGPSEISKTSPMSIQGSPATIHGTTNLEASPRSSYREMSPQTARIRNFNSPNKKYELECVFCKGNDQPEDIYKSHTIRNGDYVTCPFLQKHICGICGATGPLAHTIKYCPLNHRGFFASKGSLKSNSRSSLAACQSEEFQLDNSSPMAVSSPIKDFRSKQPVVRKLNFDIPLNLSTSPSQFPQNPPFHKVGV